MPTMRICRRYDITFTRDTAKLRRIAKEKYRERDNYCVREINMKDTRLNDIMELERKFPTIRSVYDILYLQERQLDQLGESINKLSKSIDTAHESIDGIYEYLQSTG